MSAEPSTTTAGPVAGHYTFAEKRQRVFKWSNKQAQSSGFDPDPDWGQKELFVFLD